MKKAAPIKAFGAYLKTLRKSQRTPRLRSQGGVAQWLTEHGVEMHASTLSKYEAGRPQIDAATLWMLGEAYDGVTPDELMQRFMAERLKRTFNPETKPTIRQAPDELAEMVSGLPADDRATLRPVIERFSRTASSSSGHAPSRHPSNGDTRPATLA